jgi:hypothetical protein
VLLKVTKKEMFWLNAGAAGCKRKSATYSPGTATEEEADDAEADEAATDDVKAEDAATDDVDDAEDAGTGMAVAGTAVGGAAVGGTAVAVGGTAVALGASDDFDDVDNVGNGGKGVGVDDEQATTSESTTARTRTDNRFFFTIGSPSS